MINKKNHFFNSFLILVRIFKFSFYNLGINVDK